jgi:[ribosomal protein S18]-alanine N-acetyltransferase
MTGRLVIRALGALDLDLAARFHRQAFEPIGERPWTRQDIAELVASPAVVGLIVQVDGNDAGLAILRVAADEAEVLTIAVDAACRRRGVGRALLQAMLEHARAGGAHKVFLDVDAHNAPALALYSQAGFRPVGRRLGYFQRAGGPPADAIVMRMDIC